MTYKCIQKRQNDIQVYTKKTKWHTSVHKIKQNYIQVYTKKTK